MRVNLMITLREWFQTRSVAWHLHIEQYRKDEENKSAMFNSKRVSFGFRSCSFPPIPHVVFLVNCIDLLDGVCCFWSLQVLFLHFPPTVLSQLRNFPGGEWRGQQQRAWCLLNCALFVIPDINVPPPPPPQKNLLLLCFCYGLTPARNCLRIQLKSF